MAEAQSGAQDVVATVAGGDVVAQTLAYVARSLVEHVDSVNVEFAEGERGPTYKLTVHPDDIGRVIGRGGRIARSIRQVARAAAARAGVHAFIEITG